ncbi:hypothetical protein D3C86_2217430 [compost metagenome]
MERTSIAASTMATATTSREMTKPTSAVLRLSASASAMLASRCASCKVTKAASAWR